MSDRERLTRLGAGWGVVIVLLLVAPRVPLDFNIFAAYVQDGRAPLYWGMLIGAATVAAWQLSHFLPLREESGPDDDTERPEQPAVVEGPGGEAGAE
jgi:hypothetical protein